MYPPLEDSTHAVKVNYILLSKGQYKGANISEKYASILRMIRTKGMNCNTDWDSKILRNAGTYIPINTALCRIRPKSLSTPL